MQLWIHRFVSHLVAFPFDEAADGGESDVSVSLLVSDFSLCSMHILLSH